MLESTLQLQEAQTLGMAKRGEAASGERGARLWMEACRHSFYISVCVCMHTCHGHE